MKTTRHNATSPLPPIYLKKHPTKKVGKHGRNPFSGHPLNPPSDDIYNNQVEEEDIDLERLALKKSSPRQTSKLKETNIG